jgi:catechol 2,3-dioxygenase-like lactoylglutathione lyase family enzyme
MQLEMKRVIVFVRDIEAVGAFYRDQLGLPVKDKPNDPGWMELDTGTCTLALHSGGAPNQSRRPPKIVFGSKDVGLTRSELMKRGVRLTPHTGLWRT